MEREAIAFYTGTSEACASTLRKLQKTSQPIFKTTLEWLINKDPKYDYVIFDVDQWTGNDKPELLNVKRNGNYFITNLQIV